MFSSSRGIFLSCSASILAERPGLQVPAENGLGF